MIEKDISLAQKRRYYQNNLEGKKHILLALHGYGQLAQFFYRKFNIIDQDWGLVVPEGPHRFYLNGSSGRVGASWMTKEWRNQDILENNAYLIALVNVIHEENPTAQIHLLGFSQGGATAARLYQSNPKLFAHLILWASIFPTDLEKSTFPFGAKLDFAIGQKDIFYDSENQKMIMADYKTLGFNIYQYNGGHDIDQDLLDTILSAM